MTSPVFQRVYDVVATIPQGKVATYGQIARAIGLPRGARTVGWAMRSCPAELPWHRVVNARGHVSQRGRPGAKGHQLALLVDEGIEPGLDGRIDLAIYGWKDL